MPEDVADSRAANEAKERGVNIAPEPPAQPSRRGDRRKQLTDRPKHRFADTDARRVRMLAELFSTVALATDESQVIQTAAASAVEWLGDACAVLLISDDDPDRFELAAVEARDPEASGAIRELHARFRLARGEGIAGRVLASGRSLVRAAPATQSPKGESTRPAPDVFTMDLALPVGAWPEGAMAEYRAFAERFEVQALVAVPMPVRDEVIGVIEVYRYAGGEPYGARDVRFLEGVASRAALAYDNLRSRRVAAEHARRAEDEVARTRQIVEESPIPTVVVGRDGRMELWNRAAEELFGYTAGEMVGRVEPPIIPPDRTEERAELRRRIQAGESAEYDTVRLAKDGSRIDVRLYASSFGGDARSGLALRFVDLRRPKRIERETLEASERRERQALRDRAAGEFSAAVASAVDEQQVLDQLVESGVKVVRSVVAVYRLTPDGEHLRLWAAALRVPEHLEPWVRAVVSREMKSDEGVGGRAVQTGEPTFIPSLLDEARADFRASYDEERWEAIAATEPRALMALPVSVNGTRIGHVGAARLGDDREPFDTADFEFMHTLADLAGVAIERVRARAAIVAEARRASLLREFVESSAEATDQRELLCRLARLTADELRGTCSVFLLTPDGRGTEATMIAGWEPGVEQDIRLMLGGLPWRLDEGTIGRAIQTRTGVFVPYLSGPERDAYLASLPPDRREQIARMDVRALMSVPLFSSRRIVGVFSVARWGADAEPFVPVDRSFAEQVATRAGLAFSRLELEAEREADARRASVVAEFVQSASAATDEADLMIRLSQAASDAIDGSLAIYLISPEGELDPVALSNLDAAEKRGRVDDGFVDQALLRRKTIFRPYLMPRARAAYVRSLPADRREFVAGMDLRAIIASPLMDGDNEVGILTLARYGPDAQPFTTHDRDLVQDLVARTNIALSRVAMAAERDRTQRMLQRTSQTLRAILDATPLPVVVVDLDGHVTYWNSGAEELYGWRRDEAIGGLPPYIAPDEDRAVSPLIPRLAGGESVVIEEALLTDRRGEVLPVRVFAAPVRDESGAVTGMIGVHEDLRARRELEGALRRTSELLTAILDSSPVAIMAVDEAMNLTYWNRAAEKLYGWTAHEVLGAPPPFAPHSSGVFETTYARVRAGEVVSEETQRRTRSGDTIEVRIRDAPLYDESGRFRGSIGMHEDITERRRLESQLLQAQKMETVGRLAGGVAHDFNNILTAILGYTEIARDHVTEPEALAALTTIKSSAERAAGLTRQLLAFSRRQMLQPGVVVVNEVVSGLEKILRRLIGEDIELAASVSPDAGSILVDRTQLEQAILNLSVNARDAMPDGGRLVLRTESLDVRTGDGHPEMPPGDYVAIHVSDNGVGMDEDTLGHIFEPFFTTKEVGKGTGLGLSTTYGIVRQSGGFVEVMSEPGRGSTFSLFFPKVNPLHGPERPEERPHPHARVRVLLVEDEPLIRNLARTILVRDDFDVVAAPSPATALSIVEDRQQRIDLLVTDVVMPGMSGLELARRLRRTNPGLRVLFMSGYAPDSVEGAARSHFLSKPFTPESLLGAVDEALAPNPA